MKNTDTNMSEKEPDGTRNNSFLLDEELPSAPLEFKKHMAQKFKDMGMSMNEIRILLSMMN